MDLEEKREDMVSLFRALRTIEHMIDVSCKYTRTTEMIQSVIKNIVEAYELFFEKGYVHLIEEEEEENNKIPFYQKIQILSDNFEKRGITVDLSEYRLLKRILMSDYESVGQYRKNLSLIVYLDDEEMSINIDKLKEFHENLKVVFSTLNESDDGF